MIVLRSFETITRTDHFDDRRALQSSSPPSPPLPGRSSFPRWDPAVHSDHSSFPGNEFLLIFNYYITLKSQGKYKSHREFRADSNIENHTVSDLADRENDVYFIRALGLAIHSAVADIHSPDISEKVVRINTQWYFDRTEQI
jgi:hypothetical protein